MEARTRINLGCGDKALPGFVNVDMPGNYAGTQPEVFADVFKPLPFADESADEVHAYHVFEHAYRYEAEAILADWTRVLRPGGLLVLELPSLDRITAIFTYCASKGEPVPEKLTMWGLYGDPKYKAPEMVHRWCYSVNELTKLMQAQGLTVTVHRATTHKPVRDMRLEGIKCTA